MGAQDGREKLPSSSRGLKQSLQKSNENDLGNPHTCPKCKKKMIWSDFAESSSSDGWICRYFDECRSRAKVKGSWRWFCRGCNADVCAACCDEGVVDPSLSSTQASRRSSRRRSEAEDLSSPLKPATQSVQRGRTAKREAKQKNPNATQSSSGKQRFRSSESSGSNKSSIRSTPTLEPSRELNAHSPSKKEKRDSPEAVEPSS